MQGDYKLFDNAGNELTLEEAIEFLEDIREVVPAKDMSSNAGLCGAFMDFEEWTNERYAEVPPFELIHMQIDAARMYEIYKEYILCWIKIGFFDNFVVYKGVVNYENYV